MRFPPHPRDWSMVPAALAMPGSSARVGGPGRGRSGRIPPRASATLCEMHGQPDEDFDAWLARVREAPADNGRLELIVRRLPAHGDREILDEARLDPDLGLVGDRWAARDVRTTPAYLAAQLTVISTRMLAMIEPDRARWPLAGDQLYVDLDLSVEALPPGSRLAIGSAVIEVSAEPHTGCASFSGRFGGRALRWINSPIGRIHRLRGLNARVVEAGAIRVGDVIRRTAVDSDRMLIGT